MYRQDNRSSFDPDYWLTFMQTTQTGAADINEYLMAKPEPDKELFKLISETGLNGGGSIKCSSSRLLLVVLGKLII